jgi:hypothetical protein
MMRDSLAYVHVAVFLLCGVAMLVLSPQVHVALVHNVRLNDS